MAFLKYKKSLQSTYFKGFLVWLLMTILMLFKQSTTLLGFNPKV